ncbi:MAG: GNAT family N-acetyltransferase [Chloroflexi bacterium]|nr:GNAT family N-acetyltransferase [Chloroflexota bacterium]
MSVEYRELTKEDMEHAASIEAAAFYSTPSEERTRLVREFFPPQWTVGAFVDGELVADVRTVPSARRINGGSVRFGLVGPVVCLAGHRRQGHVGNLLNLSLERMREQGQAISGLHTPHDALYARWGWERAEGKKRYVLSPKDIQFRLRGTAGRIDSVTRDDWQRLDAIYRQYSLGRNGPIHRAQVWWTESVLRDYQDEDKVRDNDTFVWVSKDGADEGYVTYAPLQLKSSADAETWTRHAIWVRDFVSISSDAYLGLWEHLLTHDLADKILIDVAPEDPFPDLVEDPWEIEMPRAEGAMIRIVDVEEAINKRPHAGDWAANFTMRILDSKAPWNDDTYRIDAADGSMSIERTSDTADVELTVGALAPIYTGYMRPSVAAGVGLLKVNRPGVVDEMTEAFAVTHPPFSNDNY